MQDDPQKTKRKIPSIFKALLIFTGSIGLMVLFFHLLFNLLLGNLDITSPIEKFSIDGAENQLALDDARLIAQTKDDPRLGDEDAPIVIVEFLDFGCPFCQQTMPVIELLQKQYPTQIQFIFRDFPIESIHPHATLAAKYANCAHQQGKFWEMAKKIYEVQNAFRLETFQDIAKELSLDLEKLEKCKNSQLIENEILSDQNDGLALGVNQTPVFFVNGTRIDGAIPYETFKRIIDLTLQKLQ